MVYMSLPELGLICIIDLLLVGICGNYTEVCFVLNSLQEFIYGYL